VTGLNQNFQFVLRDAELSETVKKNTKKVTVTEYNECSIFSDE